MSQVPKHVRGSVALLSNIDQEDEFIFIVFVLVDSIFVSIFVFLFKLRIIHVECYQSSRERLSVNRHFIWLVLGSFINRIDVKEIVLKQF